MFFLCVYFTHEKVVYLGLLIKTAAVSVHAHFSRFSPNSRTFFVFVGIVFCRPCKKSSGNFEIIPSGKRLLGGIEFLLLQAELSSGFFFHGVSNKPRSCSKKPPN